MTRNTEPVVLTIAFARKSQDPVRVANAAAVAMLNHAAQTILDASHMLGGIDDCPRCVMEAYAKITTALAELP